MVTSMNARFEFSSGVSSVLTKLQKFLMYHHFLSINKIEFDFYLVSLIYLFNTFEAMTSMADYWAAASTWFSAFF